MTRVALVTNVLAHYRVRCFSKLAELLDGQVRFYFLAREMSHRNYILSSVTPHFTATLLKGITWHRPPGDDKHLNDIRPISKDGSNVIVIGGWDEPSYLLLWLYGLVSRKRVLFWIESTAYDGARKGPKEILKQFLVKHAAGCIVPGTRALEYCRMVGACDGTIFIAPNATDHSFFADQADSLKRARSEIRSKLKIQGLGVLFVGRLVEEFKQLSALIDAFGKIHRAGLNASLMIAGDGPDRTIYEKMAERNLNGRIHFLGELSKEQLCECYAAADVLALPSRSETWGFVLNEGMEFGLPLVVSEAVGAGPDLVYPGENGFVFPVGDSGRLAEILELLTKDESLRKRMGERSKEIISNFTPEAWAKGVVRAIEAVTGKSVSGQ